jgi:vacuolar-type H+-ATPase subunit C/Vma6
MENMRLKISKKIKIREVLNHRTTYTSVFEIWNIKNVLKSGVKMPSACCNSQESSKVPHILVKIKLPDLTPCFGDPVRI